MGTGHAREGNPTNVPPPFVGMAYSHAPPVAPSYESVNSHKSFVGMTHSYSASGGSILRIRE